MNKLLKGSIAGAAGIALLLGGAGTFASWNSETPVVLGGSIVAGNLTIADSTTAASWSINGGAPRTNLTGYLAVPGDTIVYTKPINITATGDNLVATLELGAASVTPSSSSAADLALSTYLQKTATLTATGAGITGSGSTYTVTPGTTGVQRDVTVAVKFVFPKSTTAGSENNTKSGSVNLSNLAITLAQN